jgi:hypothetical protein
VAGLASAISVWFLSPTPAYFVTWGRYPLLLGGAVLPIALLFGTEWLEEPRPSRRTFLLTMLSFGGMAFAHVRLIVFYALFVLLYSFYRLYHYRQKEVLPRLLLLSGTGAIFGSIWLIFLFSRGLSWQIILSENSSALSIDSWTAIAVTWSHHGPALWLLALAGTLAGLLARDKVAVLAFLWYAVLYLFSLMPLRLGAGPLISPDLVILLAYLPAALAIGNAAHSGWTRIRPRDSGRAVPAIWATSVSIVIFFGAKDMLSVINPATVLFSPADSLAMGWIQGTVPAGSRFLVNSFAWTETVHVPSDGGVWIPYVTGHPVEYLGADPSGSTRPETLQSEIANRGIRFIYLGWRAGVLRRSDFACQPARYALVYRREGIDIYQVLGTGEPLPSLAAEEDCGLQGALGSRNRIEIKRRELRLPPKIFTPRVFWGPGDGMPARPGLCMLFPARQTACQSAISWLRGDRRL